MCGSFWSYCVSGVTQKWLPTFWEYFMIKDLAKSVWMALPLAHSFSSNNNNNKRFHLWNRPCIIVPFVNVACLIIQAGHVNTETHFSPFHRLTSLRKRQKKKVGQRLNILSHKGRELHSQLPVVPESHHRLKDKYLVSSSFGKTPNVAKNPWQEHMAESLTLGCLAARGRLTL